MRQPTDTLANTLRTVGPGGWPRSATRSAGGFTLVELLLLAVILSALAGLLLPALARAREAGRRAYCVNNLRQLSMAAILSAQDNDGFLPAFFEITPQGVGGGQGAGQSKIDANLDLTVLPGVAGNPGLLCCLSDRLPALITLANSTNQISASYAYNFFLSYYRLRLDQLPTSRIALFYDGLPNGETLGGGWWLGDPEANRGKNILAVNVRTAEYRHSAKLNVSFLDGHVEYLNELPPDAIY